MLLATGDYVTLAFTSLDEDRDILRGSIDPSKFQKLLTEDRFLDEY